MSLESGQYYIVTSYGGGSPIGRRLLEDKSLGPKGIYKLPQGTESVWEVEKLDNGNYRLKNRGAVVGGIASHLFAFLLSGEAALVTTEWTFTPDRKSGDANAFVITKVNDQDGWSVPDPEPEDTFPHIILKPVIVGLSEPPTYSPNQVFIFKKVDA